MHAPPYPTHWRRPGACWQLLNDHYILRPASEAAAAALRDEESDSSGSDDDVEDRGARDAVNAMHAAVYGIPPAGILVAGIPVVGAGFFVSVPFVGRCKGFRPQLAAT